MTTQKINKLTATETCSKIEVTRVSIKRVREYLKWNSESLIADDMRNSLKKRESELIELQNRLDTLYENAI